MELIEDSSLAQRMLRDLGEEIKLEKPLPHLTELIYCLTRSWYERFQPMLPTDEETLLFVVGVGLEKVLLVPHRQQQVGEKDGIHYSLDFLDYNDLPGELKTTRIGTKKVGPHDGWLPATWKRQLLGYLKAVDSKVGTLAVLHLMGNYSPPFPKLLVWRLRASFEELEENWAWLLERKRMYLECIEQGEIPAPFVYCEPWECERCRYKLLCDASRFAAERGN